MYILDLLLKTWLGFITNEESSHISKGIMIIRARSKGLALESTSSPFIVNSKYVLEHIVSF